MIRQRHNRKGASGMLITVISAYRGQEKNIERARAYMKFIASKGHTPLAAHVMYHNVLDDRLPDERQKGMNTGCFFLKIADQAVVFIHPETKITDGMRADIETARDHKTPVAFLMVKENDGAFFFRSATMQDLSEVGL